MPPARLVQKDRFSLSTAASEPGHPSRRSREHVRAIFPL
jgi:hypothetical protein